MLIIPCILILLRGVILMWAEKIILYSPLLYQSILKLSNRPKIRILQESWQVRQTWRTHRMHGTQDKGEHMGHRTTQDTWGEQNTCMRHLQDTGQRGTQRTINMHSMSQLWDKTDHLRTRLWIHLLSGKDVHNKTIGLPGIALSEPTAPPKIVALAYAKGQIAVQVTLRWFWLDTSILSYPNPNFYKLIIL